MYTYSLCIQVYKQVRVLFQTQSVCCIRIFLFTLAQTLCVNSLHRMARPIFPFSSHPALTRCPRFPSTGRLASAAAQWLESALGGSCCDCESNLCVCNRVFYALLLAEVKHMRVRLWKASRVIHNTEREASSFPCKHTRQSCTLNFPYVIELHVRVVSNTRTLLKISVRACFTHVHLSNTMRDDASMQQQQRTRSSQQ